MEFQCNFYDGYGFFGYTCKMFKISKAPSVFKMLLITGKHEQGKTNNDVRYVSMVDQQIETFPKNLHETFPNLTRLSFVGCDITKVSKEDLIGLKNLEEFNLNGNSLTSLPDDLFVGVTKLRQIHFKGNKLERLSSKLIHPIENSLEMADFRGNTKIDGYFYKFLPIYDNLNRLLDLMDSLKQNSTETEPQPKRIKPAFNTADFASDRHQQMTRNYVEFKASGEFSDVTLKVRGKEFKVHKTILAAQSPVFRRMFTSDDVEIETFLEKTKNSNRESFDIFLKYFYSGEVDGDVIAMDIFELASVFEVEILQSTCIDLILATLSKENVLDVYNLSCHHDSHDLKQRAFEFIQKLFPEVPNSMMNNENFINKLMTAQREVEKILHEP